MTQPHDLSRLRIDRDPPPAVRRAFGGTLLAVFIIIILLAAAVRYFGGGAAPTAETVVVAAASGGGARGAPAGATVVTANGYVVARTRAAVAAKVPGRLAPLNPRASLAASAGSDRTHHSAAASPADMIRADPGARPR